MATDPKKSLPTSSASTIGKTDIDRLLQTGLADFSLRELLGLLISSAVSQNGMSIYSDFTGLVPITRSLFPNADVQLCVVHMQRNAKTHLSKTDAVEFQQRWRAIKTCWDLDVANRQFEELCDRFSKANPTWMAELRKKREHYLAFLKYPEYM